VPDGLASTPMIATPVDFHGTPWAPRSTARGLGQHTDEVLAELKARQQLREWIGWRDKHNGG